MKTSFFIATISTLLFAGCIQQIAINSIGTIMDNGFAVLNEEQDLDIAEKSIASNLKLLEAVMKSDPENEHFLLLASIGYSSYALGFVEDDSVERARVFYRRGKEYGLKILDENKHFKNARDGDITQFKEALQTFSKNDVPAVFWTAIGWGSYISWTLTDPQALAEIPKVEAMMQFVVEKDPSYFYGGAHFFLGTLYASRPKVLGGNPELSKKHFDECLKLSNEKFLMAYVYMARSYAVQIQDVQLFEQYLTTVDTTSLDVLPQARLSNAIAKKKARLLRDKINELF
jgi:hypothetical protein